MKGKLLVSSPCSPYQIIYSASFISNQSITSTPLLFLCGDLRFPYRQEHRYRQTGRMRYSNIPPTPEQEVLSASWWVCQKWWYHDLGTSTSGERRRKAKMLIATDYAARWALLRMIDENEYSDHIDNKASHCVPRCSMAIINVRYTNGTPVCFLWLGTYKPGRWNVYSEMKRKLVRTIISFLPKFFIQDVGWKRKKSDGRCDEVEMFVLFSALHPCWVLVECSTTMPVSINHWTRLATFGLRCSVTDERSGNLSPKAANNKVDSSSCCLAENVETR